MKPAAVLLASLFAFGVSGSAFATTSNASSPAMTPIAMGCGVGQTRDAAGHCRRKFDQFRRFGQFQTFKSRRCARIQTPDGRVDRCQI